MGFFIISAICVPEEYFRYTSRGVEFYPNGNGNGMPTWFFDVKGQTVYVYDNGNGNGMPKWTIRKKGRIAEFYRNGNCNGIPEEAVSGVDDVRDAIEFMFYLVIRPKK